MPCMAAPKENHGKLVLLIGPSGVGKSVILKRLRERHTELHFPKSATTRPQRTKEGADLYHFLNDKEFDALLEQEKILEHAVVHGGARYGTLVDEIIPYIEKGKTVIREVDVQGFESIKHHTLFSGDEPQYHLESIFILPESKEQLIAHITKRAPISKDELDRRIKSMEHELNFAPLCDAQVKNEEGKREETIRAVESLIGSQNKPKKAKGK